MKKKYDAQVEFKCIRNRNRKVFKMVAEEGSCMEGEMKSSFETIDKEQKFKRNM